MSDLDLPFATSLDRPIAGNLKERPEDFRVDEIPAYSASGSGEHLFVRFEKVSLDTREAVRRIAAALGADPRAAGTAGMKDRHAITTQWASFHRGAAAAAESDAERALSLSIEGVRVLEARPHEHKLRTGHLRGNRFHLRLRGADPSRLADARAVIEALERGGVPAYFGEQRFGRARENLARARAWIVERGRAPRDAFDRKLLVSVLQSELFNALCAARVREGTLGAVIDGDLCRKEESGGMFVAKDALAEGERAARFEISATGPMFGAKMRWPEREALRREEEALARAGLDREALARFARSGEGTRRAYRFRLGAPVVDADADGIVLAFDLPAGAYATIVARELTRDATGRDHASGGRGMPA